MTAGGRELGARRSPACSFYLAANFPDLTSKARNLSLRTEGVSLFERHPPHFSTGVYTLFELMDLSPGQAVMVKQGSVKAVQQLHKVINERVEKLIKADQQLASGIPFWEQNLFTDAEVEKFSALLVKAKEFLESLQAYNTPGKLKNLKYDADNIFTCLQFKPIALPIHEGQTDARCQTKEHDEELW